MTKRYGGLIFKIIERSLAQSVERSIKGKDEFSSAVPVTDISLPQIFLTFVSFDASTLQYVCLAESGRIVATGEQRVRFSHLSKVQIPWAKIHEQIPLKLRPHLPPLRRRVVAVPPKTWQSLLEAVSRIDPKAGKKIKEIKRLIRLGSKSYSSNSYTVLGEERDAVGLALEIFADPSERRRILKQSSIHLAEEIAPFLHGVQRVLAREDPLVNRDAEIFPGFVLKDHPIIGVAHLQRENRHLTIINTNRQPLETTLGVDLLYYNHQHDAFVFVQYKRMSASKEGDQGEWYYPRHDNSYEKEIATMRNVYRLYKADLQKARLSQLAGYRLECNPFLFKLCKREQFAPLRDSLVQGLYVPLSYWGMFMRSGESRGPRGATRVGPQNLQRWISNSLFVDLVKGGWLGSSGGVSQDLGKIVRSCLESGRSVVIAVERAQG
jgi:hypothetical protein